MILEPHYIYEGVDTIGMQGTRKINKTEMTT